MKFRGKDLGRGTIVYGRLEKDHLSVYGKSVSLEAEIERFIENDVDGKMVYEGDIIILPKKKIEWSWGEVYETHGEEFQVPRYHEPRKFTQGQLEIIISESKLKEHDNGK